RLLMVPADRGRAGLQRQAAEKGWGLEDLEAAIPRRVRRARKGRQGGRPFRRPATLAAGLKQVARHGRAWLRRHRHAWAGDDWLAARAGAAGPGRLAARRA